MKRFIVFTLVLMVILAGGLLPPAFAGQPAQQIPVEIDGLPVAFDVNPVIQNGRTLVPFRALAERLNVRVTWEGTTQTVIAEDGKISVRLRVGNRTAYRDGAAIDLDAPPVLLNGRTLIPARFFSEAFGCLVTWDDTAKRVKITSPPRPMTVIGFYALGDSETSSWSDLFARAYPHTGPGNTDLVSHLALGWYSLDREGNLLTRSRTGWERPDGWESVLKAAGEYNLKTEMVLHLADGDGTISSLLTDQSAMARAVGEIAREARLYNGVNLDFEGLGWKEEGARLKATRDSFTGFVRLLSGQLKAAGIELTLTLHAPNSAYKGYDYQRLGELADWIVVMAYDYGPVPEPAALVTEAVEAAKSVVTPGKLILGISAPTETPESILTKAGIAKRYNLNGIAIWRLGLVSDDMWNSLRTTILSRNSNS
ncbi:MAG: stalk domain-containing protein [Bacillota bacterium]